MYIYALYSLSNKKIRRKCWNKVRIKIYFFFYMSVYFFLLKCHLVFPKFHRIRQIKTLWNYMCRHIYMNVFYVFLYLDLKEKGWLQRNEFGWGKNSWFSLYTPVNMSPIYWNLMCQLEQPSINISILTILELTDIED